MRAFLSSSSVFLEDKAGEEKKRGGLRKREGGCRGGAAWLRDNVSRTDIFFRIRGVVCGVERSASSICAFHPGAGRVELFREGLRPAPDNNRHFVSGDAAAIACQHPPESALRYSSFGGGFARAIRGDYLETALSPRSGEKC